MSCLIISLFYSISSFADDAPTTFTLTTNAFLDTGALPVLYTCDGKDSSPELSWSNPPAKTKSFVLIVSDPDAPNGTFYHWIVYNIPATTKELLEGTTTFPPNTLIGTNSKGEKKYSGPCPPRGSAHTYHLALYALDNTLTLPAGVEGKTVEASIKNHVLKKAEMTTVYSRWLK
ncbi:MAG: YbhB/YbcL family Raf kinase inhibitor-like protein [Gammaproteobacteria bacterium]|nr:YbhB/YbcL family Raf kinase inhibitor-like protein [Gammaproteobacteria bacterium]